MSVRLLVVAVLVLAGCASSNGTAAPHGTVRGIVLAAPMCPVQRAGQRCPPAPVAGASVVAVQRGEQRAATTTDAGGHFRLDLPPGRYMIVATNRGGYRSQARHAITVRTGLTTIRLTVDSGIR